MEQIIKEYVDKSTWKIKENSNAGFSLSGLKSHIANHVLKAEQLSNSPAGEYHKSGALHIHDLSGGSHSGYCYGSDLMGLLLNGIVNPTAGSSESARHFDVIVDHIVNYIYISQNEWEGAQAFSNFDTLLAPFVRYDNLTQDQVKQNLQRMVYNLSYPLRAAFQSPFSNLSFDLKCPDHMKNEPVIIGGEPMEETYSEFQKEMDMINIGFLDVMLEGDRDGRPHTFPIPSYSITKDFNWDCKVTDKLFELTAKFGLPYFMSYCLVRETPIIKIGDNGKIIRTNLLTIKPGQKIWTPEGFCEVLERHDMIVNKTIQFEFSNGSIVTSTPEHQFPTSEGLKKSSDIEVNDLIEINNEYYDTNNGTFDHGRFLGLYIAEGWNDKKTQIQFPNTDIELIDFFDSFSKSIFCSNNKRSEIQENGVYRLLVNSKSAIGFINDFLFGNNAHEKRLNSNIFNMSKEFRKGVLFGWLEGDGHLMLDGASISRQLIKDMHDMASSIGIQTSMTLPVGNNQYHSKCSNLRILASSHDWLNTKSKGDVSSSKTIFERNNKYYVRVISKKIDIKEKQVIDIKINSKSHIFTLANGILTHNCGSGLEPSSQRAMCCFSGKTKIISSGNHGISYKNIKEFRRNETPKVLINGEFKNSKWFKMTCEYMYNIKFANGIDIRTSPDHPCVTQRGVIESENITTDDWMPFSLLGYEGKDGSYDLGRFIGLYLAEGSKHSDCSVTFSFNENERNYIDFVSNFACMYYGATTSEGFSDNSIGNNIRCINVVVNSKTVHDLIEEYIGGNLAINKYLKSKVFKMSKEFRQGLLDGEYQGDGSTQHRMCTASKQLSEDLACLISSIGSVAGITVDNRTKEDGKLSDNPLYLVRPYSLNRSKYKNIFKIDESGDKIWIKVKEIHKSDLNKNEKYVYDFEMQTDDHLFQLANGLITHNCRLQMDLNEIIDMSKGGWWNTGVSTGSLGVVSINMPQLGYLISREQHEDLKPFYDRLDELINAAKQHLIYKRKMVEYGFEIGLMPFTREYLKDFSHFFSTIGIVGMNECCLNLFGKPIYECVGFTENVLNHISNRCREFTTETGYPWNFEETPAEGACYSLALKDKKMYPDIITQGEGDSVYYSNSSHIPVGDGLPLGDSLNVQAAFKQHYSGGTLFHIWAGEGSPSPGGVKDLIKNICHNTTLPYIAYTKAYAICPQCGITDDLSGICPKCNDITDVYSRVTGFYRPIRNYNPGKTAEFNDRKMFNLQS